MENKNNEQENENEVSEAALKYGFISPEEYLKMERLSPRKNEYFNGQIVAMAGASPEHIEINCTLFGEVYHFLRGKACRPLNADFRVVSPEQESYTYPDLTIVCKDPMMADREGSTFLNPSVIIEILSKSTGKYDMGHKFLYYQKIPSLRQYILIDSRKRYAKIFRKELNGEWNSEDIRDENGSITIRMIGLTLSFDTIYLHTDL